MSGSLDRRIDDVDAIHPDADSAAAANGGIRDRAAWNASADEEMRVPGAVRSRHRGRLARGAGAVAARGTACVPAACCLMWYEGRPRASRSSRAPTRSAAPPPRRATTAVTGALLEWIERDAMAIWWDNRLRSARSAASSRSRLRSSTSRGRPGARSGAACSCSIARPTSAFPAYVAIAPRDDGSEPLVSSAADLSPRSRPRPAPLPKSGRCGTRRRTRSRCCAGDPPLADSRRRSTDRSRTWHRRADRRAA